MMVVELRLLSVNRNSPADARQASVNGHLNQGRNFLVDQRLLAFAARELYGTPGRVLDLIGQYRDIGVQRIYLQIMDMTDLDYIGYVAEEVVAHAG